MPTRISFSGVTGDSISVDIEVDEALQALKPTAVPDHGYSELRTPDGETVYVNRDRVAFVREARTGTAHFS